eukprot:9498355-Pyramimonas_sp.AAC.1
MKMYVRGQWCIGEFEGVEVKSGQSKKITTSIKRKSVAENADQLGKLASEATDTSKKWARTSSSIIPTIATPGDEQMPYAPVEGEVTAQVHDTKFLAACQHDLAMQAQREQEDGVEEQQSRTPTKPSEKKERSKMVLQLAWDAEVSKQSAVVIASVTTKREKMDTAIAESLGLEDMTTDNAKEMTETAEACRLAFATLKTESDAATAEWSALKKPSTEDEFKQMVKAMAEEKQKWTTPKLFNKTTKSFVERLKELTDKVRDYTKAADMARKSKASQSAAALRSEHLADKMSREHQIIPRP